MLIAKIKGQGLTLLYWCESFQCYRTKLGGFRIASKYIEELRSFTFQSGELLEVRKSAEEEVKNSSPVENEE